MAAGRSPDFASLPIFPSRQARTGPPAITDADPDGDGLPTEFEHGWLLDPNKPDTDGDGLIDGNDRNPLTKPAGSLSEDQIIVRRLALIYAAFLAADDASKIKGDNGSMAPWSMAPLPRNDLIILRRRYQFGS